MLAASWICSASAGDAVRDQSDWQRLGVFIDGAVSTLMEQHHTVSGVVAVEHAGETVLLNGYGWQSIETGRRVDPAATMFRQASISKLFTWVAVMQLVAEGRLDLDSDVNQYLRDVHIRDTFPGRPVTLRNCMTHTAGFEEGFFGFLHPTSLAGVPTPTAALRRYQPRRVRPPGAAPAYSNYCAALAGLIVSDTAQMPFADYVRKRILEPLAMRHATFDQPPSGDLQLHVAQAYSWVGGKHVARTDFTTPGYLPTGGLLASAPDMLKFGRALLNDGALEGARILDARSVQQLFSQQFTLDERLHGIGLGFLYFPRGDVSAVGHNGNSTNFSSHFGMVPQRDLVIYVAFGGPGYREVQSAVTRALYRKLHSSGGKQPPQVREYLQPLDTFLGTYGSRRSNESTLEKLLKLRSQVEVSEAGGALMIGAKRYVSVGHALFRGVDEDDLVAFQVDAVGRSQGYVADGAPYLSMYRLPLTETVAFNRTLVLVCASVFAAVLLRWMYQRNRLSAASLDDRRAHRAALITSATMLWTLIFGWYALSTTVQTLFSGVPTILKVALIFPLLASAAAGYLLYHVAAVWRRGLLATRAARVRFTGLGLCAVAMVWFFAYWNILGFQYA